MQEIRKKRVESLLQETISTILVMGEVKDHRLNQFVTITGVTIARDMKDAKVHTSVLGDDKDKSRAISVLNHAAGYIQKLLSHRVRLRYIPRLTFIFDPSLERGFRINQRLKENST